MLHGRIGLPRNYGDWPDGSSELTGQLSERFSLQENIVLMFSPGLTRVDSANKFNQPLYKCASIAVATPLLLATLVLPIFRRDRLVLFLYLIFFSYCLPYLLLRGQTRYRIPIDFVMISFLIILVSVCPWLARKITKQAVTLI